MVRKRRNIEPLAAPHTRSVAVDGSGDPLPLQTEISRACLEKLPDELQVMIFRHVLLREYCILPETRNTKYARSQHMDFLWGTRRYRALLGVNKEIHDLAACVLYGEAGHFT